ncbi:MAG: hypothetical protein V4538_09655 [Bacteroidota bacterium]
MSVKTVFAVLATSILFTSCAVLNQPDSADDDLYYGKSTSTKKVKMVPTVDLEKIKRENPSQIDPTKPSGYNNNVTPNPNAAMAYPAYKAHQDSMYRLHPELSGYYQAYSMPPFSLSDEYKRIKAERRQARRMARINNRRYYNNGWNSGWGYNNSYYGNYGYNNYGYNNWNNGWGYNNWNNFGPSINFGWNSWNGWNSGIGFGWNQPFYSGCNSFYNPWNNYYGYGNNYYQPYYPYYPSTPTENNPNPPQSRPRDVIGSNLPATNGGTIDNPNPNPQHVTNNNGTTVTPGANQQTPAATNSGGTLINTPNGVQYIAPRTTQSNQAYPSNSTSLENNRSQNEYRQNNPQYFDNNAGNNNNQPQPNNPNVNNNSNVPRTTDNYQQNNNNQNYQPRFVEPSRSSSNSQPSAPSNSAPRGGSGGGGSASPGMSRPR